MCGKVPTKTFPAWNYKRKQILYKIVCQLMSENDQTNQTYQLQKKLKSELLSIP